MCRQKSIIGGLILMGVGFFILLAQNVPALAGLLDIGRQWPLIIVAIGGMFLVGALLGTAELAIPGSILTGLGLIFYYQNLSGNWGSWAYVWTLIPGFVGLGMIIAGTLDKTNQTMRREGGRLLIISSVMFLIFGTFFNLSWGLFQYWPLLLIGGGLWLLVRNWKGEKQPK